MSAEADAKGEAAPERPRRKPYRTPRLERLGTLNELTADVGSASHRNDHAGPHTTLTKTA